MYCSSCFAANGYFYTRDAPLSIKWMCAGWRHPVMLTSSAPILWQRLLRRGQWRLCSPSYLESLYTLWLVSGHDCCNSQDRNECALHFLVLGMRTDIGSEMFVALLVGYQASVRKFLIFWLILVLFQLISESIGLVRCVHCFKFIYALLVTICFSSIVSCSPC